MTGRHCRPAATVKPIALLADGLILSVILILAVISTFLLKADCPARLWSDLDHMRIQPTTPPCPVSLPSSFLPTTALAGKVKQWVASVCPSVGFHSIF